MQRQKILLLKTWRDADILVSSLVGKGLQPLWLDPGQLLDDEGQPLFAGRTAGLLVVVEGAGDQQRVAEAVEASASDVKTLDREAAAAPEADRLVPLCEAGSSVEAELLRNQLAEEGIRSAPVVATGQMDHIDGQNHARGAVRIVVAQRHAERGRQIVEQFQSRGDLDGRLPVLSQAELEENVVLPWPTCPQCSHRRLTICPVCKTSGSDFPQADGNYWAAISGDADAPPRLAAICTGCDEPWLPEFLRRCEWCGHDFGEGIDMETPPRPASTEESEPLNHRMTMLIAGMVLGGLALIVYFASIASR